MRAISTSLIFSLLIGPSVADDCTKMLAGDGSLVGKAREIKDGTAAPVEIQIVRGDHPTFIYDKIGQKYRQTSQYEGDRIVSTVVQNNFYTLHYAFAVAVDDGDMASMKDGDVSHYRQSTMVNNLPIALQVSKVSRVVLGHASRNVSGCDFEIVRVQRDFVPLLPGAWSTVTTDFAPSLGVPLHVVRVIHRSGKEFTFEVTVDAIAPQ